MKKPSEGAVNSIQTARWYRGYLGVYFPLFLMGAAPFKALRDCDSPVLPQVVGPSTVMTSTPLPSFPLGPSVSAPESRDNP